MLKASYLFACASLVELNLDKHLVGAPGIFGG